MSVWGCIEGTAHDTWQYVPFGIVEDLRNVLMALEQGWPGGSHDDTAWSVLIAGHRLIDIGEPVAVRPGISSWIATTVSGSVRAAAHGSSWPREGTPS